MIFIGRNSQIYPILKKISNGSNKPAGMPSADRPGAQNSAPSSATDSGAVTRPFDHHEFRDLEVAFRSFFWMVAIHVYNYIYIYIYVYIYIPSGYLT